MVFNVMMMLFIAWSIALSGALQGNHKLKGSITADALLGIETIDTENMFKSRIISDVESSPSRAFSAEGVLCYGDALVLGDLTQFGLLYTGTQQYNHFGSSGGYRTGLTPPADERYDLSDHIWIIRAPHGFPDFYRQGEAVSRGDVVRLYHPKSGRYLLVGPYSAPLGSMNYEVSTVVDSALGCNFFIADVVRSVDGLIHGTDNPIRFFHPATNRFLIAEDKIGAQTADRYLISAVSPYVGRRTSAVLGVMQVVYLPSAAEVAALFAPV